MPQRAVVVELGDAEVLTWYENVDELADWGAEPSRQDPFELLWAGPARSPSSAVERVVPTGHVHVVWRACGTPIRLGVHGEGQGR